MNWEAFENFIGEEIPRCIKVAFILCGYDTILSICEIQREDVSAIEAHLNTNRNEQIEKMACNHSDYYTKRSEFCFLPGHRTFILALPKYAIAFQQVLKSKLSEKNCSSYFMLNELLRTAELNKFKDVNHATYPRQFVFSQHIFFFFLAVLVMIC